MSSQQNKDEEQKFTIQPHPQDNHSNTGNVRDPNAVQAALSGNPGPAVIDPAMASKLETPKSKEELAQLSAKLNKND